MLRLKIRKFFKNASVFLLYPQNVILIISAIVFTLSTISPLVAIVLDTVSVHRGSIDSYLTGKSSGFTFVNYIDLFTSRLAVSNLWIPLLNTIILAVGTIIVSILYGGVFAFLENRTDLKCKKYIAAIFIVPYIMPQWTQAVVWHNVFSSNLVTGTYDGVLATMTGIHVPLWFAKGLLPSILVLGTHYAPFAYILISGIFKNIDSNLEEAATILGISRFKTFISVTLPLVRPAIFSTILLVAGSAIGSYCIPHYLSLTTLTTKYISMNAGYAGEASILAIIMMLLGIVVMYINHRTLVSRKNYTTVTGKVGQISKMRLPKALNITLATIFIILSFFTSIFPVILFAIETFLPNPGDYSFFKTFDTRYLTSKWWLTNNDIQENGMYGQQGILYNPIIKKALFGTLFSSALCSIFAGLVGTLIGYAISKNRRSKLATYVNNMSFFPYLMPSLAVGAAFFVLFSKGRINWFNTYKLLILVGAIKYIPFASKAALNSMMQISSEIEESAVIQGIPWHKRMTKIMIPLQKQSIIAGFMLPFMTSLRELSLYMLLCTQGFILSTTIDYFDEMGLYAFSSGINLLLILIILISEFTIGKITGGKTH